MIPWGAIVSGSSPYVGTPPSRGRSTEKRPLTRPVERKLRVTIETGLLIRQAQDALGHKFEALVGRFLGFGQHALRSYVVISKKAKPLPDFKAKWYSLRDAAEATDLIPVRDGHGKQNLHAPNFFTVSTKAIMGLVASYRKHVSAHPLDSWDPDTLEQFAVQLKPIVDIYAQTQKRVAAMRK